MLLIVSTSDISTGTKAPMIPKKIIITISNVISALPPDDNDLPLYILKLSIRLHSGFATNDNTPAISIYDIMVLKNQAKKHIAAMASR